MCVGLCQCLLEFAPYLTVVFLPVLGAFLGTEVVLRVSVSLCLQCVVISLLPKQCLSLLPLVQAGLFAGLLLVPLVWVPWWVVWVYGQAVWVLEPALLVSEVVLVQNVVMRLGQWLADNIHQSYDNNSALVYKAVVVIFSAACYAVGASWCWEIYKVNTPVQNGCLLIVALLVVAVHNMFWMAREGVISDAAFCTVCMVAVIGAMSVETTLIRQPLPSPPVWNRKETGGWRVVDLIVTIFTATTNSKGVAFLTHVVITPFFLLSLALRLYSIIFIVSKVTKNFFLKQTEEDLTLLDEDELLDPMSMWRSPLLLKLSVIFMLSQLTSMFLWQSSGAYLASVERWLPWRPQVWLEQVLVGRVLQVVAVFSFYLWRLYCADAWTWNEWLTP